MPTCPQGHVSRTSDYCDVCGAPMPGAGATAQPKAPAEATVQTSCPNCGAASVVGALFCESCGYDFTTGALPRSSPVPDGGWLAPPAEVPDDDTTVLELTDVSVLPEVDTAPQPTPAPVAQPAAETEPATEAAAETEPAARERAITVPVDEAAVTAEPEQAAAQDAPQPPPIAAEPTPGTPPPLAAAPSPTERPTPRGRPTASGPTGWVAEIWIDPDWYGLQTSSDQLPSPGLPRIVSLPRSAAIGRTSISRAIHPEIDCDPDTGVSRQHALLTTDGSRWFVEDVGSSNGTFLGRVETTLPQMPIAGRREITPDDRVYVGSWTRIVVRPGLPDEISQGPRD